MQRCLFCFCILFTLFFACQAAAQQPPIHVFIHVCTINHWKEVLDRQLNTIYKSGLYDECDSISLGVLGNGDITHFKNKYPKVHILFQNPNTNLFERPTLKQLYNLCLKQPDALVLYLHTKGVRHVPANTNITDWSLYMEYFAVENWRDCVEELQEHDICGVKWNTYPHPHFSGNFWWATAKYIAKLPEKIGEEYYDPEFWIGTNSPDFKSFHTSYINHYKEPYPPSEYRAKSQPYVLAAIPSGDLGLQLEEYWNTLHTPEWKEELVIQTPPHCKLISGFASNLRKSGFKKALKETVDLMKQQEVSQKIRVVNLLQGHLNQKLDFIQIKSPYLMQFAKLFADNTQISSTPSYNTPLQIALRENVVSAPWHSALHVLQRNINLSAENKWLVGIFKMYGDQMDLLITHPID